MTGESEFRPRHAYIWEYMVRLECAEAFEKAYGSEGDWVRLFRRAEGYVSTELFRDASNERRYLTVDTWDSAESWEAFRRDFADEFEAIDARCEELTEDEREIARVHPVD